MTDQTTETPKVSVCVITYNQVCYLGACLQSILDQQTDFPFEVIVGDDCSIDGTQDVLRDFAARYPDIIKPIFQPTNTGGRQNYLDVHNAAVGEYVAHIDGDDLMFPGKLAEQESYMSSNPLCSISWHRMLMLNGDVELLHPKIDSPFVNKKIFRHDLALLGPFGAHSSTMYRRLNFDAALFPNYFNDWYCSVLYISNGYGIMLDSALGAYRVGVNGLSGGSLASKKNRILLINSQKAIVNLYPHLTRHVSTRVFANFILDAIMLRSYCLLSLGALLSFGSAPIFSKIIYIYRFYNSFKLPSVFKK